MEFDDANEKDFTGARIDFDAARQSVLQLIKAVGEDPEREGLKDTPARVSRMYS